MLISVILLKGALILKEKYLSPTISVEVLERTDILLSLSSESSQGASALKEKENAYGDFMSFALNELGSWFD